MDLKGVLVVFLALLCFTQVHSKVSDDVKSALNDIYNAAGGSGWNNHANWLEGDPCENSWYGVTCNEDKTEITSINLISNNLSGTISDSIGSITTLETIYFVNNKLHGSIPDSIGNLANIGYLYFSMNTLSGTIPSTIGNAQSLVEIDFSQNSLSGTLPSSLTSLPSLEMIEIRKNYLSGTLPSFSNSKLHTLSMKDNKVTGQIPNSLANCPLNTLFLNSNNFSGVLPPFLQTDPQIQFISLQYNNFSCPLPEWCGDSGNKLCTPCIETVKAPSPSPQPDSTESTDELGDGGIETDNTEDGGDSDYFAVWFILGVVGILVVIIVVVLVAMLIVMKRKHIGLFTSKVLMINSTDDDSEQRLESNNTAFELEDEDESSSNFDGDTI